MSLSCERDQRPDMKPTAVFIMEIQKFWKQREVAEGQVFDLTKRCQLPLQLFIAKESLVRSRQSLLINVQETNILQTSVVVSWLSKQELLTSLQLIEHV